MHAKTNHYFTVTQNTNFNLNSLDRYLTSLMSYEIYLIHKDSPMNRMNEIYVFTTVYLRSSLIISSHQYLAFPEFASL